MCARACYVTHPEWSNEEADRLSFKQDAADPAFSLGKQTCYLKGHKKEDETSADILHISIYFRF